ncbi:hypothetical protein O6H91_01G064300 [Diphasiastrum complanatum]|uniref:Uncharacterized protein n=1 Tax=Diphasiastrum complanatum TaxID=34168 RepID=A0ACC2ERL9_DIPCM|nr:hypothetical protein O6H91_01G064300 [Diphasiastrum complanatum]
MGISGSLSSDQIDFYRANGYLVLEKFSTEDECKEMLEHMESVVEHFDPYKISIFSTKNQKQHTDEYFYESANNISFFFEEKAFDAEGRLQKPKSLAINKVGHALHDLDPVFRRFSRSMRTTLLLSSLGYKKPILMQSMYIFKQPGIGGEVVPHQDNSFLYTEPQSCVGLWLALEDATVENGCLWILSKSHKGGTARRFLRDHSGVRFDKESPNYDFSEFVPVEVKRGSLVVLHGDVVHQSFENTSEKSRHAYTFHVVEGSRCSWSKDNWLQRKSEFPAEPLYDEESTVDVTF